MDGCLKKETDDWSCYLYPLFFTFILEWFIIRRTNSCKCCSCYFLFVFIPLFPSTVGRTRLTKLGLLTGCQSYHLTSQKKLVLIQRLYYVSMNICLLLARNTHEVICFSVKLQVTRNKVNRKCIWRIHKWQQVAKNCLHLPAEN